MMKASLSPQRRIGFDRDAELHQIPNGTFLIGPFSVHHASSHAYAWAAFYMGMLCVAAWLLALVRTQSFQFERKKNAPAAKHVASCYVER
jgi:hypothetical protein